MNTKYYKGITQDIEKSNETLYEVHHGLPIIGAKHTSSGDETPPIPEEELEQQKIEHERQLQKERESQAREAEEVRQLDIELRYQRAIEAEEEYRREPSSELRGMNTSWSHHRLSDLQRQAARWRHSRPSIPDTTKNYKSVLKKACSAQLSKPQSSQSIGEEDGIFIDLTRKNRNKETAVEVAEGAAGGAHPAYTARTVCWRASASDVSPRAGPPLQRAPSCPGSGMRRYEMQGKGVESSGGKEGSQMSRSESTISRCTPHTPLGPPDSVSVDSNPMPTIYRCRAPIASLDCMDDFSANSQQMLDQAGGMAVSRQMSTYMGNHATIPSTVTPGLRYKNLGKSGLRVPNVGLGLWTTQADVDTETIIEIALDHGINLFDLSEAHCVKADLDLSRVLKRRGLKRSSVIVTLKVYWSTKSDERGLSRKHIVETVQNALTRLNMDYIDVVLLHKVDPICPMEELVRTMTYIINQGWVMYWGTARWSPSEIMEAYTNCRQFNCVTPIAEQTEYHMFCREKAELYMPELYHKIGVGMMVWSAITTGKGLIDNDLPAIFAKSRFNRKYSTFSWCEEEISANVEQQMRISGSKEQVAAAEESRPNSEKIRDLVSLASTLNCTLSQLAVAWCLKNESVNCLLLGAYDIGTFKENIHALQIVPQLTPMVMAEIERVLANKPLRPPMVSTLAMRTQQNNIVRLDMTGAPASGAGTPKPEGEAAEGEVSTPGKESGRGFCEIQ